MKLYSNPENALTRNIGVLFFHKIAASAIFYCTDNTVDLSLGGFVGAANLVFYRLNHIWVSKCPAFSR